MRIVAAFVQNERSAAAALFGIEPQSFNHLANRGGVECRHAAWNAREPGGSVGRRPERKSETQRPLPHGA
jgi:hypothetical protein